MEPLSGSDLAPNPPLYSSAQLATVVAAVRELLTGEKCLEIFLQHRVAAPLAGAARQSA